MNGNTKELLERLSYHRLSWSEILDEIGTVLLKNIPTDKIYIALAGGVDCYQTYPAFLSHTNADTSVPVRMSLNPDDWPANKAVVLSNFCDALMTLSSVATGFKFDQPAIVIPDPDDVDDSFYIEGVSIEDHVFDAVIWLHLPSATKNTAFFEDDEDIYSYHDDDEDEDEDD